MKRLFLFFSCFFIFFSSLFSLKNNFRLSIEPLYSIKNGTLYERVFVNDGATKNLTKLSELVWPINNVSFIGAKVCFGWKFLEVGTTLSFAIPKNSGYMADYDWLDYNGNYVWDNPFMCTNYSLSNNKVTSALNFSFWTGATFNPFLSFHINPFLGYSYNSINFFAQYGFYQYASHSPYTTAQPLVLPENAEITYERQTSSFLLGLSLKYVFFKRLTIGLSAYTTPLNYTESIDHHHKSNTYYLDIMTGYFTQWGFNALLEYKFFGNFSITSDFEYILQLQKLGKNYERMGQKKFYGTDLTQATSGCCGDWWSFSCGIKYEF